MWWLDALAVDSIGGFLYWWFGSIGRLAVLVVWQYLVVLVVDSIGGLVALVVTSIQMSLGQIKQQRPDDNTAIHSQCTLFTRFEYLLHHHTLVGRNISQNRCSC